MRKLSTKPKSKLSMKTYHLRCRIEIEGLEKNEAYICTSLLKAKIQKGLYFANKTEVAPANRVNILDTSVTIYVLSIDEPLCVISFLNEPLCVISFLIKVETEFAFVPTQSCLAQIVKQELGSLNHDFQVEAVSATGFS